MREPPTLIAAPKAGPLDGATPSEPRQARRPASVDRPLSPAAVEAAKRAGTYTRGDLYHVCDGCRAWVDSIWWISPQYPRSRLCAACATAIGKGPQPREAGHATR